MNNDQQILAFQKRLLSFSTKFRADEYSQSCLSIIYKTISVILTFFFNHMIKGPIPFTRLLDMPLVVVRIYLLGTLYSLFPKLRIKQKTHT